MHTARTAHLPSHCETPFFQAAMRPLSGCAFSPSATIVFGHAGPEWHSDDRRQRVRLWTL